MTFYTRLCNSSQIQQAGIFTVTAPIYQLKQIIESNCANFLHAYLSKAISNTIIQAGFSPVILQPLQPAVNQEKLLFKESMEQELRNNVIG